MTDKKKDFQVFKNERNLYSIVNMNTFQELKQEFETSLDAENFICKNIFFHYGLNEYRINKKG